jgi:RNA polymerase sigma-70 factor, ECF subfamily
LGVSSFDQTSWDWGALRQVSLREARRILRATDQAEDAAQEAVIRAWRHRGSCREPGDPGRWVAAIARREALRRAATSKGEKGGRPAVAEMDPGAHEQIEGAALRLDVRRAVSALTPVERRLLDLRYRRDLTHRAVADELGMPEGTVKVRLHRLRGLLRERLQ